MNVTEAKYVNIVVRYHMGDDDPEPARWGAKPVTWAEAQEALAYLADKAYDRLSAGIRADEVLEFTRR